MTRTHADVLRDQGRGIAGALFVSGLGLLYTMETWFLGWRLPMTHLLGYAIVGLAGVFVVTDQVGFQEDASERPTHAKLAIDFSELVLQSFLTAYLVLFLFGVVRLGDSLVAVVRLGLVQVVPLGFGAALANRLLAGADDGPDEPTFPDNVPTYLLGAVFVALPVAPTDEVALIALQAGWLRLAGLVGLSVVIAYLVLYELEFRGHSSRTASRSRAAQVGSAFLVYAIGTVVAVGLLLAFGQYDGAAFRHAARLTIVLSFLAATGASAGEVVL